MEEGAVHKDKSTVPYWPCTTLWRKPRRRRGLIQVKNTNPLHISETSPLSLYQNKTHPMHDKGTGLADITECCSPQHYNLKRRLVYVTYKHSPQQNELDATPN